jgi:hypothetical protein
MLKKEINDKSNSDKIIFLHFQNIEYTIIKKKNYLEEFFLNNRKNRRI